MILGLQRNRTWLLWGIVFKSKVLDLGFMDGMGACERLEMKCKMCCECACVCACVCTRAHAHTMSIILRRRFYSFYQISIGICDSTKVKNHIDSANENCCSITEIYPHRRGKKTLRDEGDVGVGLTNG